MRSAPFASRYARSGMVCAVDQLAAQAGVAILSAGGNAVDAAIATSAVLAVTTQHMCGLGGDLFALVHSPADTTPLALNASGHAGAGASAQQMRDDGHRTMPMFDDIRSVPVPGCVDGWGALHERLGRLPLADVLAPAIGYAANGFPAAQSLVRAAPMVADRPGGADFRAATHPGAIIKRAGVARTLTAVATDGRNGFYLGEFGDGLRALAPDLFATSDMARSHADWVSPLSTDVWGARVWTVPPNSQGYLTLAAAWIASQLELPNDPDDPQWAHLTIEAARLASYTRVEELYDGADGAALIDQQRLAARRAMIRSDRAADLPPETYAGGGTIYLCAVDADRMGVSLIQSNAAGFGSLIAEANTGIFLQNRGLGFSLEPGHPAELAPGKRPPHTLAPALVTTPEGALRAVVGSMGGDAQPQIVLQLLARMLHNCESMGDTISAGRWVLSGRPPQGNGFDTWGARGPVQVHVEAETPASWDDALSALGHSVVRHAPLGYNVGHAHAIAVEETSFGASSLEGASDPRSLAGGAVGY